MTYSNIKRLIASLLILLLITTVLGPQLYGQRAVPLGKTFIARFVTTFSSTGAEVAADSAPTCDVYEDSTSTPIIIDGSMTLMTSTTNVYWISIAATSGNGFEVGKSYNQVCKATVSGLLQNIVNESFFIYPTEGTTGYQLVDVARINNVAATSVTTVNANQGTTQPVNFTGTGASAVVKADTNTWNGTAVAAPDTAGIPEVNVKNIDNDDVVASGAITFPTDPADHSLVIAEIATRGTHSIKKATSFEWGMRFFDTAGTPVTTGTPSCTRAIDSVSTFAATTNSASAVTAAGRSEITLSTTDMNGDHYVWLLCTLSGAVDYEMEFKIEAP